MEYAIFIGLGVVAGVLSGMIGIGGGVVLVPALSVVLAAVVPPEHLLKTAIATSLASIIFTGAWAAWRQWRAGMMDVQKVAWLSGGTAAGSLFGGLLAPHVPADVLRGLFGVFALYVGLQMLLGLQPRFKIEFNRKTGIAAGVATGAASSWIGIGGGSFIVPFLNSVGESHVKIAGTSSGVSVVVAFFATAGYALTAHLQGVELAHQIGYVNIPALLGIVVGSLAGVLVGIRVARWSSAAAVKRVFAVILLVEGGRFLLGLAGLSPRVAWIGLGVGAAVIIAMLAPKAVAAVRAIRAAGSDLGSSTFGDTSIHP